VSGMLTLCACACIDLMQGAGDQPRAPLRTLPRPGTPTSVGRIGSADSSRQLGQTGRQSATVT
jgi:hypothetical protein